MLASRSRIPRIAVLVNPVIRTTVARSSRERCPALRLRHPILSAARRSWPRQLHAPSRPPSQKGLVSQLREKATALKEELMFYRRAAGSLVGDFYVSLAMAVDALRGDQLSPRERKHLWRSLADLVRLVPVIVILALPGSAVLFPLVVRKAPWILPSSFLNRSKGAPPATVAALRRGVADHMRALTAAMIEELHDAQAATRVDLERAIQAARTVRDVLETPVGAHRGAVDWHELFGGAPPLTDDNLLSSCARSELLTIAHVLGHESSIPTAVLRFALQRRARWLKRDDVLISQDGVDSLPEADVRVACTARGLVPASTRSVVLATAAPRGIARLRALSTAPAHEHPMRTEAQIRAVLQSWWVRGGEDARQRTEWGAAEEGGAEEEDPDAQFLEEMRHKLGAWVGLSVDDGLPVSLLAFASGERDA